MDSYEPSMPSPAARRSAARKLGHILLAIILVVGLTPVQYWALSSATALPAYADDGGAQAYQDTADYIGSNADAKKTNGTAGMSATGKYIVLKDLFVDRDMVGEHEDIHHMWTDKGTKAVFYQTAGTAQLFDPGNQSPYYVADVSAPQVNGTGDIADIELVAGTDGMHADRIPGASEDADKGLVYIPKSYYDDDNAKIPQAQAMVRTKLDMGDTKVDVDIDNNGHQATAPAKEGVQKVATFDASMEIQVATPETAGNISGDDITVTVNGNRVLSGKAAGGDATYDSSTGKLALNVQPSAVKDVKVEIADNGGATVDKAYAASLESEVKDMGYLRDLWDNEAKFAKLSSDDIKQGMYDKFTAHQLYAGSDEKGRFRTSDSRPLASAAAFSKKYLYGTDANDGSGTYDYNIIKGDQKTEEVWKKLAKRNIIKYTTGDVAEYANFALAWPGASTAGTKHDYSLETGKKRGWHTKRATVKRTVNGKTVEKKASKSDRCGVALTCADIGSGLSPIHNAGVRNGATTDAALRIVYRTDDYAVIGFLSSRFTTQAGSGLYKVALQTDGNCKVKKVSANASVTNGNSAYSNMSGAKFKVYQDKSDAQKAAKNPGKAPKALDTLTTGKNGNTEKSKDLPAGTYWIAETKAPKSASYNRPGSGKNNPQSVKIDNNETATVTFKDAPRTGHISVQKTTADKSMTDGNDCYSYKNAVFGVYKSEKAAKAATNAKRSATVDTLTTQDNGKSKDSKALPFGTYWVKELKAPAGYKLGDAKGKNDPVKVTIDSKSYSKTVNVTKANAPVYGQVNVLLKKYLGYTENNDPTGDVTNLANATFTIEQYGRTDGEASGKNIWKGAKTLTTNAKGEVDASKLKLPLGTYKLTETKAPTGLKLWDGSDKTKSNSYIFTVTQNGEKATVSSIDSIDGNPSNNHIFQNKPTPETAIIEVLKFGGIEVSKADSDRYDGYQSTAAQGSGSLKGAVFGVYNASKNPVYADWNGNNKMDDGETYQPGQKIESITADQWDADKKCWVAKTPDKLLSYGTYRIVEEQAPEGYTASGTTETTVAVHEDGKLADATLAKGILNKVARGGLVIGKGDAEQYGADKTAGEKTSEGRDAAYWNWAQGNGAFKGAEFTVYNRSQAKDNSDGAVWIDGKVDGQKDGKCQKGEMVPTGTSNTDANKVGTYKAAYNKDLDAYVIDTGKVLPYGHYEVVETKAPEGYKADGTVKAGGKDDRGRLAKAFDITEDGQVQRFVEADGMLNVPKRGGLVAGKADAALLDIAGASARNHAEGDAKLDGAVFEVVNRSAHGVTVPEGGKWVKPGEVAEEITTAWDDKLGAFVAKTGERDLPYGTYEVREKTAPEGYVASGKLSRTFQIREDGSTVLLDNSDDGEHAGIANEPARGGLIIGKGDAAKYDAEKTDGEKTSDGDAATFWNWAQGDATFKGAEFTVYNHSQNEIWFDRNGNGRHDKGELVATGRENTDGNKVGTFATEWDSGLKAYVAKTGQRLPYGTYEVVETKAPEGYKASGSIKGGSTDRDGHLVKAFQIHENGYTEQLVEGDGALNEVIRGDVQAVKNDKELDKSEALGGSNHTAQGTAGYRGASLTGIRYEVTNRSRDGVLVGDKWFKPGERIVLPAANGGDKDGYLVTHWNEGKSAYTAETLAEALPYGTYGIREIASKKINKVELANDSYLMSDGAERTFQIREDGKTVEADKGGASLTWRDQVVRNDVHLEKKTIGENGSKLLAHVPFVVTNTTTGESHVVVTNEDGHMSTGAAQATAGWNDHSQQANANDALAERCDPATGEYLEGQSIAYDDVNDMAGTWFSKGEDGTDAPVDDSLGALPYGHYTIKELRCETNQGLKLWDDAFDVERDSTMSKSDYNLGTVDDAPLPTLSTEAVDSEQGDKTVQAGETVRDTGWYDHMDKGTYTISTEVHKVTYDEAGKASDRGIAHGMSSATEAKVRAASGTFEVKIATPKDLEAGDYVVFETVKDGKGNTVLDHRDAADADQTFSVVEGHTTATDKADGDKIVDRNGGTATLHDVVDYKNLRDTGKVNTMTCELHQAEKDKDGKWVDAGPVKDADGEPVTKTIEFTPETRDGSVEVDIDYDPALVEGTKVVAFETCKIDGAKVFVHANIDDAAQTLTVPKIGTTATNADDGGKTADAGQGTVRIADATLLEGLPEGDYEVAGVLMDKATGESVKRSDGTEVTASAEQKIGKDDGKATAELTFLLDASELSGHDLVAYETVTDKATGNTVATHRDLGAESQTVRIVKIGTHAADKADGDQIADATGGKVAIDDTVDTTGLPAGEYTVKGTAMDKATGKAVEGADGKPVTAEAKLTVKDGENPQAHVVFEFDAEALAGHDVVAFERAYDADGKLVASHEDIDDQGQTVRIVKIGTTAVDKADGDHVVDASGKMSIDDTVATRGLPAGEYTVTGTLMDRQTKEAVKDSKDKPVTATAKLTVKKGDESAHVVFEFEAPDAAGHDLVAFERAYDADGKLVASHEDYNDAGQTVRAMALHTTATDKADGDKQLKPDDKKASIDDAVKVTGAPKGGKVTISGQVMDKATGKAVKGADGKPVTASTTYTPQASDETVHVRFDLSTEGLDGHELVVFETAGKGKQKLAEHRDIDDAAQTVTVGKAKPSTPAKPASPQPAPGSPDNPTGGTFGKTGNPLADWAWALAAAAAAGAGAIAWGRHRRRADGPDEGAGDDGSDSNIAA